MYNGKINNLSVLYISLSPIPCYNIMITERIIIVLL